MTATGCGRQMGYDIPGEKKFYVKFQAALTAEGMRNGTGGHRLMILTLLWIGRSNEVEALPSYVSIGNCVIKFP